MKGGMYPTRLRLAVTASAARRKLGKMDHSAALQQENEALDSRNLAAASTQRRMLPRNLPVGLPKGIPARAHLHYLRLEIVGGKGCEVGPILECLGFEAVMDSPGLYRDPCTSAASVTSISRYSANDCTRQKA